MNVQPPGFVQCSRRPLSSWGWLSIAVLVLGSSARGDEPPLPDIPPLPLPLPPAVKAIAPESKTVVNGKQETPKGKVEGKAEPGKVEDKKEEKAPLSWKAWRPPGRPITLGECLDIARTRQPAILAAQHSLAASERGYLALMGFHRALDYFSPDLPFRRQQAVRGLAAMTATVQKAIQESVYDTTRVYYEYVRASQQELTATDIIDQMETFYKLAKELVEAGVDPRKLNKFTLYGIEEVIEKVKQLREKASYGRRLAVAALAQAMGLEPGEQVYPADSRLPVMGGQVTEEQVVQFALAARPELVQVAVLVDVSRLEVCAQAAVNRRHSLHTFASGTDLHSQMLPAAIRNGDYRPGAVPPEMPPTLVGKREDRVARAAIYSERMDEVYRATVNLVRLEAVNAYLNWKATSERLEEASKRFERGKKLADESSTAAATKQDPELRVRNEALAGEAQAAYVEAVYEHLKALLTLERVTAGQVKAGFPTR